jgi:hypothetical protein
MTKRTAIVEKDGAIYGRGTPRKVPEGRVLAHNHVRHHARMSCGINGFRWWTWPKGKVSKGFVPCGCGYAGLPHVAAKRHAETYKCETRSQIRTADRLSNERLLIELRRH